MDLQSTFSLRPLDVQGGGESSRAPFQFWCDTERGPRVGTASISGLLAPKIGEVTSICTADYTCQTTHEESPHKQRFSAFGLTMPLVSQLVVGFQSLRHFVNLLM